MCIANSDTCTSHTASQSASSSTVRLSVHSFKRNGASSCHPYQRPTSPSYAYGYAASARCFCCRASKFTDRKIPNNKSICRLPARSSLSYQERLLLLSAICLRSVVRSYEQQKPSYVRTVHPLPSHRKRTYLQRQRFPSALHTLWHFASLLGTVFVIGFLQYIDDRGSVGGMTIACARRKHVRHETSSSTVSYSAIPAIQPCPQIYFVNVINFN